MAVPNYDDAMRRRFALADMGKFQTSPKNLGLARRGSDPEPPPPATINPNDPASGAVYRTRNGQRSAGYLPLGQRAPYEGTWPPFTRSSPPPAPLQGNSTWGRANANPAPGAGFGDLRAREAMRGADTMQIVIPNDPARYANLNANPAPGGGFGDLREREAMRGADRPEPVATGSAAPAATGDLSQRVGDERRALMSDYESVMRELVNLGSRGRDTTPEMQTRRAVLINARKAMESRLRDLAMATPRTNVVSPEDAKVARERLARTSGVDTRTPMERGMTSIANRTMPGAGSVLGEATAMSADKMAFNERQMARDARQAEGARRLTTALPGGEAPLAMMERERAEMQKRRADQVALEQATAERAIRNQTEGSPEERLAMAQAKEAESRAGFNSTMTDIERQRMLRQDADPRSVTNTTEAAQKAVAGRTAAREISGYTPESILAGAKQTLQNLPTTLGATTDPVQYGTDVDTFIANVVGPLEELAQRGDTSGAAQAAAAIMGNPALRPYTSLMTRMGRLAGSVIPGVNIGMGGVNPFKARREVLDSRAAEIPTQLQPHAQRLSDALARLQHLANTTPSR